MLCKECGDKMQIDDDGISNHLNCEGFINHDADAGHIAIADKADESEEIDLFEHLDEQPLALKEVVAKHFSILNEGTVDGYKACGDFLSEVEQIGYTFEYYLDAEPYGLKKKTT